jgi:hypothetical protein
MVEWMFKLRKFLSSALCGVEWLASYGKKHSCLLDMRLGGSHGHLGVMTLRNQTLDLRPVASHYNELPIN